jgi:hypothetical protein
MSYWDLNNKERETCDPSGLRTSGDWRAQQLGCLNQDLQDFLALNIDLDGARSSLVLNQDFQDFED